MLSPLSGDSHKSRSTLDLGPRHTCSLHCSSCFWYNQLSMKDCIRYPQKGTTMETIGSFNLGHSKAKGARSYLHELGKLRGSLVLGSTIVLPIGPLSSSLLGLPHRILNIDHTKELLRGLWVATKNQHPGIKADPQLGRDAWPSRYLSIWP